jgi:serine protease
MACPQVSGIAALMLSANPSLSATQVRHILCETAIDLGVPGPDDEFGHGLVDAFAAIEQARFTIGEAGRPPRLSLSTTILDFGAHETTLTVGVSNGGGGVLTVEDVSVHERIGQGWLTAKPGGRSAGATVTRVDVTVERGALPPGRYHGVVEIAAAGVAAALVDVHALVVDASGQADAIHVLAVDPQTGQTIAQTRTNGASESPFVLDDVGKGFIQLWAGTDRDGDGEICESHDACGAWPSVLQPLETDVATAGAFSSLTLSIFEPSPGTSWPSNGLRLRQDSGD